MSDNKPQYMVPSFVIVLDKLPLNSNGKVNKQKLLEYEISPNTNVKERPKNETEKRVFDIVTKVFGYTNKEIGVTDNLYTFGLNSLVVVEILSELATHNIMLEAKDIIDFPTIRDWARIIDEESVSKKYESLQKNAENLYPLTDTALLVYSFTKQFRFLANKVSVFNIDKVYRFNGVTGEKVKKAFLDVIDAHPGLKARLVEINGAPYMKKRIHWSPKIDIIKLNNIPDNKFSKKMFHPFNILSDDFVRVKICEYKDSVFAYFSMHHIVSDDVSLSIILSDLKSSLCNRPILKEKYDAFDVANIILNRHNSKEGKLDDEHFSRLLRDIDLKHLTDFNSHKFKGIFSYLPVIFNKPIKYKFVYERYPVDIVDDFCTSNNITVSNFFLAAYIYSFCSFYNNDYLVMGILNSKRNNTYTVNTVACIFGAYPVVYHKKSDDNFLEIAKKINEQTLQSLKYDFSFRSFGNEIKNVKMLYNCMVHDAKVSDNNKNSNESFNINIIKEGLNTPAPIDIAVNKYDKNYHFRIAYKSIMYDDKTLNDFMKVMKKLIDKVT